jgi:hypothetical protein
MRTTLPHCTLANITRTLALGTDELEHYVTNVYGREPETSARAMRQEWFVAHLGSSIEVVWWKHLPTTIRDKCTWPKLAMKRDDVF